MKKAFLVTSSIDVDNSYPLTYTKTRTFFSPEERLRQTVMTMTCLDLVSDQDTEIYVLDNSENTEYRHQFAWGPNIKFISIKEEFPEIHQTLRTHPHKSYCECKMLTTFLRERRQQLEHVDYFIKLSGRYFTDSRFNISIFNENNLDKMFYKKPLKFEWHDSWGYSLIDRRKEQGDNKLRQYCTVLYGWGRERHGNMMDMLTALQTMCLRQEMYHMDVESLSYFFTRPFENQVIETDWLVYGWEGASGRFMRY